jgi:hypothetical protein
MSTLNENTQVRIPPIYVIDLCGPRAMQVIGRYPDVLEIAAYGQSLPHKVASFQRVLREVKDLEWTRKQLVLKSTAEVLELRLAIRRWLSRLQLDIEGLEPTDILITETNAADVWLANARHAIEMLEVRGAEVADAEQARSALMAKAESTQAAWEATQAGRAAVQNKQRELRALATDLHQDLVKLRKTVRLVLGGEHADYKLLTIANTRAAAEAADETATATETEQTEANSTAPSNGSSSPTSSG